MKTAILFFHNQKEQEAESKHWFRNAKLNLRLADMLIEDTRKKLLASGLPLISFDSSIQEGHSFAEKLSNAIAFCFSNHQYEHLIVVGSDTPDMTTAELKKAALLLEQGACPIGLSKDGGIYLFGVSRLKFDQVAFQQILWGKHNNAMSFMAYSHKLEQTTVAIGHKTDFDHASQLQQVHNMNFIKIWLSIKNHGNAKPKEFSDPRLISSPILRPRRGPPAHQYF